MTERGRSLGRGSESLRHRAKRVLHELGLAVDPDFPNSPLVNSRIHGIDDVPSSRVSPDNVLAHGRFRIGPITIDFREPMEPLTFSEIKPQQDKG